jgi:hypothetical protein
MLNNAAYAQTVAASAAEVHAASEVRTEELLAENRALRRELSKLQGVPPEEVYTLCCSLLLCCAKLFALPRSSIFKSAL